MAVNSAHPPFHCSPIETLREYGGCRCSQDERSVVFQKGSAAGEPRLQRGQPPRQDVVDLCDLYLIECTGIDPIRDPNRRVVLTE